ncbi:SRPBCC family protein [Nocardia sp. NPDC058379]|uniref:SRPBCC family protein n=1 Tax=unclassified Nocardia TaxID=2637762 RepID=UPI00366A1145
MHRVSHSADIAVPVEVCFAYVDDMRKAPEWMFGVTKCEPIGPQERGLGAVVAVTIKFGPMTVHSLGTVTEYCENALIALTLTDGPISGVMTWRFEPRDPGRTRIAAEVAYTLVGGLTGRALAKVIDALVTQGIEYTEGRLRRQLLEPTAG